MQAWAMAYFLETWCIAQRALLAVTWARKAHLEHQDADCEGAANAGLEAVLAGHALRAKDEVDDGQEHLHCRCLHAHSVLSVQRAMAEWTHLHDSSEHALSKCRTED
jgi:hypothetical protein